MVSGVKMCKEKRDYTTLTDEEWLELSEEELESISEFPDDSNVVTIPIHKLKRLTDYNFRDWS